MRPGITDEKIENNIIFCITRQEKYTGMGLYLGDLMYCRELDDYEDDLVLATVMELVTQGRIEFHYETDIFVDLNHVMLYATLPTDNDSNSQPEPAEADPFTRISETSRKVMESQSELMGPLIDAGVDLND